MLRYPRFRRCIVLWIPRRRRYSTLLSLGTALFDKQTKFETEQPSHNSSAAIRLNPFQKKMDQQKTDYNDILSIPLDTSPHPYPYVLDRVRDLSYREMKHLQKIACKEPRERKTVVARLTSAINDLVKSDPRRAYHLYSFLSNEEKDRVADEFLKVHESDKIACSLMLFISNPGDGNRTHQLFKEILSEIVHRTSGNADESKAHSIVTYLSSILATQTVNPKVITINGKLFQDIQQAVGADKHADLYAFMVQINFRPASHDAIRDFRLRLFKGSPISKFVASTGMVNASWPDLHKTSFNTTHTARAVEFFTLKEFEKNIRTMIANREPAQAMWALGCMQRKFERICSRASANYETRYSLGLMLSALFHFVTELKDVRSSIPILDFMKSHDIPISFPKYHNLLRKLRISGNHDEFLAVLSNMDLKKVTSGEKQSIGEEILRLIAHKYASTPKALIGYVGALVKPEVNVLNVLNELKLLSYPYEEKLLSTIASTDVVQLANIDSDLQGMDLSCSLLSHVYEVMFRSMPSEVRYNASVNLAYFEVFENFVQTSGIKVVNDRPLTVFFENLLSRDSASLDGASETNYQFSKRMFAFYDKVDLDGAFVTKNNLQLLIETALYTFNDFAFANKVIEFSMSKNADTFHQIFPFVIKYDEIGREEEAAKWFKIIETKGLKASWKPMPDLVRLGSKYGKNFSPGYYRSLYSRNRQTNRRALEALTKESPLSIDWEKTGET
ncbi:uncharacterized protein LODBEIA_P33710 [Lodderomyces beijingensis]|uniref:Mitochondrial group I intron splicing factor CCM1 n=1 Tax=Lodderomyces beijingensis TaxID=1775926 RepID=A0ABP0ZLX8_9ASCO